MNYQNVLRRIHQVYGPRTYLEVGVNSGRSIRLARPGTCTVGIDPAPRIVADLGHLDLRLAEMTSDAYFADRDGVKRDLGNRSVDFAFIDGMHHFEFALRDFANIEALSNPHSVIALHDGLPIDRASASRDRTTNQWSGDVWKTVVALKAYRRDLNILTIDVPPTGLTLVGNLDPASRVLHEEMDQIVERMHQAAWDDYLATPAAMRKSLGVKPCLWRYIRAPFPSRPWREEGASRDWHAEVEWQRRVARHWAGVAAGTASRSRRRLGPA